MAPKPRPPAGPAPAKTRYLALPERIPFEAMVESVEAEDAKDPEMGRDANSEFMLRYM